MHGVKRVLVFCLLIVLLPTALIITPLYLRRHVFADVTYAVAESDIIEIRDGISSIFCDQHTLRMDSIFNAFQLRNKPEISTSRKHIRLKKSMTLPDDTLEYWGFYLLRGALVHLKFCSRYDGSRILVVKGDRELKTCGLLDHNKNKFGPNFAHGHNQVKVFFEDLVEINEPVQFKEEPPASAIKQKVKHTNEEAFMEAENHAAEDMSVEDILPQASNATSSTTVLPTSKPLAPTTATARSTSKPPRTGAISHYKSKKTEEPANSLLKNSKSIELEETNRSRRHQQQNSSESNANAESKTEATATILDDSHYSSELEYQNFLRKHLEELDRKRQEVYDQLYKPRKKREREHVYDRKYSHGGNALNFTGSDESNSISSFENGLLACFNGDILLAEGFPPSVDCMNAHFLENGSHRMMSKHEITEDGYYYYIFYSDNDLVRNDIHAIFDIYKPTFQYSNLSDTQGCVNTTNCTFPIRFLSNEIVVVEVPTRDGIEHEEDDITYLISTCHPRMEVYAIFPIMVLVLILCCSFL